MTLTAADVRGVGELAPSVLGPVRSANTVEETLERILRMVKLGFVLPGERLPSERELARRLEISRPTIREAIRALAQTGYVEVRRGRRGGAYVVQWLPAATPERAKAAVRAMGDQLEDVLDLRAVVEPGAAALAAERLRPEDRPRLHSALEALRDAVRVSFPAVARAQIDGPVRNLVAPSGEAGISYRFADCRLHLMIGDLTYSQSVSAAVMDVQVRVADFVSHTPQIESVVRHSDEQHAEIVAAIEAGDPERARVAMREHVAATTSYLRGFLGG